MKPPSSPSGLALFNPRRRLQARIALMVGGMIFLLAVIVSSVAGTISKQQIKRNIGESLAAVAAGMLDTLDRGLFERLREVQIVATLDNLRNPAVPYGSKRALLEKMQSTYTNYAWIGIAGPDGTGLVGTQGYLEGKDLSIRPWFAQGRKGPYAGDVHDALLLSKLLPNPSGEMLYLLDVAAPIHDLQGRFAGVLCGHIHWRWTEDVLASLEGREGLEVFLIGPDNMILAGPPELLRKPFRDIAANTEARLKNGEPKGFLVDQWNDGRSYLTGFAGSRGYLDFPGLGWRIMLRQNVDIAYAPALALQQRILMIGAGLGLLFALIGWFVAGRIARPIESMSEAAQRISEGDFDAELPIKKGQDELAGLSASLRQMVANLTREIRARSKAEEGLRLAATVYESSAEGIVITDADNRIISTNPGFTALTGYAQAEVLGSTPSLFKSGRHDPSFYREMWLSLLEHGTWQGEMWNRRKNGEVSLEWLRVSLVRDEQGEIKHYIAAYSDLSEIRRAQEEAERLASHDSLTGLANRARFLLHLEQRLEQSRSGGRFSELLLFDIDRFKAINEARGLGLGDALLRAVGDGLCKNLSPDTLVARLDSDLFAILPARFATSHEHAAHEALSQAERIRRLLRGGVEVEGESFRIELSAGITLFPDTAQSASGEASTAVDILRQADMALSLAKSEGGNCVRFFEATMGEATRERFQLERELHEAIDGGQLRLYLQQQVEADGTPVGAEALVRWQHPTRGLLPPGLFVPLAEASDLIVSLDRWMLAEVCRLLARLDEEKRLLSLSVNISARHFQKADFVEEVKRQIAETGANPACLVLEVTESLVIGEIGRASCRERV